MLTEKNALPEVDPSFDPLAMTLHISHSYLSQEPGSMSHPCEHSPQEPETGGWPQVLGQPGLYHEPV